MAGMMFTSRWLQADRGARDLLERPSNAACVKEAIDGLCSHARFEQRRQEVVGAAPDSELRSETCPHCNALVDLSGFPPSPQVLCPCCGSIGTLGRPVPILEEGWLRICDTCHYFGFPECVSLHRFATFPFVFMVETETATLCGSCMRTEAWINLRGNLLSVVGVPISAVELLLAHLGGSRRYKRFGELDRANEAATNEKPERAEVLYERLLDRVAPSAPLHYNRAKLRADHEDWSGAVTEAVAALADCSNFACHWISPAQASFVWAASKRRNPSVHVTRQRSPSILQAEERSGRRNRENGDALCFSQASRFRRKSHRLTTARLRNPVLENHHPRELLRGRGF